MVGVGRVGQDGGVVDSRSVGGSRLIDDGFQDGLPLGAAGGARDDAELDATNTWSPLPGEQQ
ncbi:hypothetical protein VO63_17680 [Streptomyces showdoensis]|uniref:Uncharacterized protein n=1 Tax=Streptomyces showdoensis TaxID=68268 RepID=A0A2P2GM31_STREW|nr:hypothetical protein VO63_17680 [Streptomyces showdoensis]